MAARKWLVAAAAGALLAGCASGPYDSYDPYYDGVAYREYPTYYAYRDYPYGYYYGPRYYSPPVVSFGLAYNRSYWRHPGG